MLRYKSVAIPKSNFAGGANHCARSFLLNFQFQRGSLSTILRQQRCAFSQVSGKTSRNFLDELDLEIALGKEEFSKKVAKFEEKHKILDTRTVVNAIKTKQEKKKLPKVIQLYPNQTPRTLSQSLSVRVVDILKMMIRLGLTPKSSYETVTDEVADLIVSEHGFVPKRNVGTDLVKPSSLLTAGDWDKLPSRAPIVAVMGHINHGKTSLLDALRDTNFVDKEVGGITQKLAAFQAKMKSGHSITFVDTPGHEAFEIMRARGTRVIDMVVLVIAADEGVLDQTVEAIKLIRQIGVPVIIAINKIDKSGADPQKVKTQLLEHEIVTTDFGGDIHVVELSAVKRTNLDLLEDEILLLAEVMGIKSKPDGKAEGIVLEGRTDKRSGYLATTVVRYGKLCVDDIFVNGTSWGRVRTMKNEHGELVESAGPAVPVEITGFRSVPVPGEELIVVDDERQAQHIVFERLQKKTGIQTTTQKTTEDFAAVPLSVGNPVLPQIQANVVDAVEAEPTKETAKQIRILVRADLAGSADSLKQAISSLISEEEDEISLKVLGSDTGDVTEADVMLAETSNSIIVAFNSKVPARITLLAREKHVRIFQHDIIYQLLEQLTEYATSLLDPIIRTEVTGVASIEQVFPIQKKKNEFHNIAGCYIQRGSVSRKGLVQVVRKGQTIFEGKIETMRHHKEPINEAKLNTECGISLEGFDNLLAGDEIHSIRKIEFKRKLGEKHFEK